MDSGASGGPAAVVSTYPDRQAALRAARDAVGSGLAACVNMADISSVYRWNGRIEEGAECLALFKTTRPALDALKGRIAATHPYDVPEIAELAIGPVNGPYLDWLAESTSGRASGASNSGGGASGASGGASGASAGPGGPARP